jgi:YegS/Rv2252/BmrU family lipid kinase
LTTATLIYNPIAGRKPVRREHQIRAATRVLQQAGIGVSVAPTTGPGHAGEIARKVAAEGSDMVLVCGGDGTINEVINGLVPATVPLGILPGGTANIIARELKLPMDPVGAARALSSWTARRVPVGLVTTSSGTQFPEDHKPAGTRRYFLSVAGVGFDGHVIYRLSHGLKMSLGVAAYVIEALRQLWLYRFPRFIIRTENADHIAGFAVVQRTVLYAGWLHLAPGTRFFDPGLNVCIFRSQSRWRYFVYAAAVLARCHLRLRDVKLISADRLEVTAAELNCGIHFELDGELVGRLPAKFEVVPDALTLLVPKM